MTYALKSTSRNGTLSLLLRMVPNIKPPTIPMSALQSVMLMVVIAPFAMSGRYEIITSNDDMTSPYFLNQ
jgi:hypothetical protein